ncbi:MAG TPA: hypothetical protein VHW91_04735 [Candidatus Dormibacteraeota bacterium]|nr:hypothetical protein [Candidatus Dormibacteraeota bacterium]
MSGAQDPIQESLPFELPKGAGEQPAPSKAAQPPAAAGNLPPSLYEQLWSKFRSLPWAQWRAQATPMIRGGAQQVALAGRLAARHGGEAARLAMRQGGTVAELAVKRGAPYTFRLARATAQISLIRALPLAVARTIHLVGFPAVVLRTAMQYTIAHRAGLTIDEVVYFRVDDPAGYTVYEAPPRLGTAIAIAYLPTLTLWVLAVICLAQGLTPRVILDLPATWVTWLQIWLGLACAAHGLPAYEEAGPVAEQARVGVVKADPVAVFWVIPAQIAAVLTRFGGILPAILGALACWWLAAALIH